MVMSLTIELRRSSPIPLYYQLAQTVKNAIDAGHVQPGEVLESDIDLARRIKIARNTVRKGLALLIRDGYLQHTSMTALRVSEQSFRVQQPRNDREQLLVAG